MVMVMDAYLFDVPGFRQVIAPLLDELTRGEVALLRAMAFRLADANPQIWHMLGAQKLTRKDLNQVEARFPDLDGRINLWMLTILAAF